MNKIKNSTKTFIWRVTTTHTISYFFAGIFALLVLRYDKRFGYGALSFMRSTESPWVAAGMGLQIVRGIILSLFLLPFKEVFINTKKGWVKFWFLLFGLGYLITISPAIGSFEGIIYTNIPMEFHLLGIPEIILYMILFATLMWGWYKKPNKIFNILSMVFLSLIILMSVMGVLDSLGLI